MKNCYSDKYTIFEGKKNILYEQRELQLVDRNIYEFGGMEL